MTFPHQNATIWWAQIGGLTLTFSQNLGKTFRELFQINTSEMNSPQPMSLIQHLAVLHHCLRCQLGTGFDSKYLLQDVSKLLILSKFFNFSRNKGVSKAFSDDYQENCGIVYPQKKFTFSFTWFARSSIFQFKNKAVKLNSSRESFLP